MAAEAGQFGSVCRYSLQDGQPSGRNATATIPINRRGCEGQPGTMVWRHDSQVGGWSCDASRTDCLFFCEAEAVLDERRRVRAGREDAYFAARAKMIAATRERVGHTLRYPAE